MKDKKLLIYILIGITVILVYTEITKSKNIPDVVNKNLTPDRVESNYIDRLFRSVNDVAYNLLFGWWL